MMLLADIGNTRIKWAESRDNRLRGYGAAVHAEIGRASCRERV